MSIAQNLVNNIIRWKALPLQALFALEDSTDNYKSFITTSHRLKRQGLIDTAPMGTSTGDKVAFPTKKLLSDLDDEDTLKVYEKQLTHDALVSLFCLGMLKLDSFIDADIDDRLYGINRFKDNREYYPDAVLMAKRKKSIIEIPIELELTQKSHRRIKQKFEHYTRTDYYKKVIFVFTNKRLMEHYHNIFMAYFSHAEVSDIQRKVIFTYASMERLIKMDLADLEGTCDSQTKMLSEINYFPSAFFQLDECYLEVNNELATYYKRAINKPIIRKMNFKSFIRCCLLF